MEILLDVFFSLTQERVRQLIGCGGARVFQRVDARLSSSRKNRQLREARGTKGVAPRQCVSSSGGTIGLETGSFN